jgi:hypothetical protein
MNIRINFLSSTHLFLGIKFTTTKLVEDLKTFDKNKEYPKVYHLEIGLLFVDITIEKRGS